VEEVGTWGPGIAVSIPLSLSNCLVLGASYTTSFSLSLPLHAVAEAVAMSERVYVSGNGPKVAAAACPSAIDRKYQYRVFQVV
jgi:ABC-type nitrate/sulfonate/bicarbonate transport system ATPase subunit